MSNIYGGGKAVSTLDGALTGAELGYLICSGPCAIVGGIVGGAYGWWVG